MSHSDTMKRVKVGANEHHCMSFVVLSILFCITLPHIASAQSYVPVQDIRLNPAFNTYSSNFNNYRSEMNSALTTAPDSLRDIIAGPDPGGVAKEECQTKDARHKAFAYGADSPWGMAVASTSIPTTVPISGVPIGSQPPNYVRVNASASLRCLLQEIVEQNKLGLSLQIHTLLKQYIADAQQKQLSNQLLNQLNGANLAWAKSGVQINQGGVVTTESAYITNYNDSVYNRAQRTVSHMVNRAAAPPGDPNGSLELCDPLTVSTQVAENMRSSAEDTYGYFDSQTRCTLNKSNGGIFTNNSDVEEFYQDPNTPSGPGVLLGFSYLLNTPQNTNQAGDLVTSEAEREVQLYKQNYRDQLTGNGGFQPTEVCVGNDCPPNQSVTVSPAALSENSVVSAIADNRGQILSTNSLDDTVSQASRDAVVDTSQQPAGLLGFNPVGMQTTGNAVNELVQEFWDSIAAGYFDVEGEMQNWAWATMLMIYDEMSFNSSAPNTAIPTGGGNATPKPVPI